MQPLTVIPGRSTARPSLASEPGTSKGGALNNSGFRVRARLAPLAPRNDSLGRLDAKTL